MEVKISILTLFSFAALGLLCEGIYTLPPQLRESNFNASICHQGLNRWERILESPNYPFSYPANAGCIYNIYVPGKYRIIVVFIFFELESSSSCHSDYLEIRDGPYENSDLLAKICGNTLPEPIEATGNAVTIKFHSDGWGQYRGFKLQFYRVNCDGNFSTPHGTIESPYYPSPYPAYSFCTWHITVPGNSRITLSFITFQLDSSSSCQFDSLEVRDGPSLKSGLLYKFCGNSTPEPIKSTGNAMTLKLRTDGWNHFRGFRVEFHNANCDGNFNTTLGTIDSPNYPNHYSANSFCTWHITVPEKSRITLSFRTFHLQNSDSCEMDYLEVRDGPFSGSNMIKTLCGSTIPDPIVSTGNAMTIRFRTDASLQYIGFRADFHTANCDGAFNTPEGTIESPNYPSVSKAYSFCTWHITVPRKSRINLSFKSFQLESSSSCQLDYLEVRDGPSSGSHVLTKLCGSTIPVPIVSTGNAMTLRFRAGGFHQYRGFKVEFYSVKPTKEAVSMATRNTSAVSVLGRILNFVFLALIYATICRI